MLIQYAYNVYSICTNHHQHWLHATTRTQLHPTTLLQSLAIWNQVTAIMPPRRPPCEIVVFPDGWGVTPMLERATELAALQI